jgi:chromate transporter
MTTMQDTNFVSNWKEIVSGFLKLGVTAYGGPAIMGLMQAELQEKRQWVPRERFVEGLSLVNMVPGATATQLGIFLGHARGGWWSGLLAGLCFVLPAFGIMLALTMIYAHLGATPLMRGGLFGTLIALLTWRIGARKLMIAGSVVDMLWSRLLSLPGVKAALYVR